MRNEVLYLSYWFNYTFSHNLSDFHSDHFWPNSEAHRHVRSCTFVLCSALNAWTETHGDGRTANFTSKQRYCMKPVSRAAGTHEISDNHYLWKLVNFSQLQKVEKSVQLHSPWAKLPTQCAFENKRLLLSVVIWRSI